MSIIRWINKKAVVHIHNGVFSSVLFSRSIMSNSLRPHESQHTRPPCPSPTPGIHSDSRPSSQWCHPAISSSVVPFSCCSQSIPASKSSNESTLHMRWPKYWSFSFKHHSFQRNPRADLLQNGLVGSVSLIHILCISVSHGELIFHKVNLYVRIWNYSLDQIMY